MGANQLKERVEAATSSSTTTILPQNHEAASDILRLSSSISTLLQSISHKEECYLVPALATIVPSSQQKSFNSRVLCKLGLMDARVHLVRMYDAVHDEKYGSREEVGL